MWNAVSFHAVDAFAEAPFTGNRAGVVLEADGLSDAQMQRIAAEINASETAFVSQRERGQAPRLRWFTPTVEVEFCGHATLAAAHASAAIEEAAAFMCGSDASVVFDTAAGPLELHAEEVPDRRNQPMWWLRIPPGELQEDPIDPERLCRALGVQRAELVANIPIVRTRDDDLIVMLNRWRTLVEAQPDMCGLAALCQKRNVRGVLIATTNTLNKMTNVASRFFAPAAGVSEDPVTGSVHGPLAQLLVERELVPLIDFKAGLNCMQGPPAGRTGVVRALVERDAGGAWAVSIGGFCHTTMRGEIRIP